MPPFLQKLIDRFGTSRYATLSFLLHVLIIAIFGGTVLFKATSEPPDFEGESGSFVSGDAANTPLPPTPTPVQPQTEFTVTAPPTNSNPMTAITTMSNQALSFQMDAVIAPPTVTPTATATTAVQAAAPPTQPVSASGLNAQQAAAIGAFTKGWGKGNSTGSGTGTRQREFEFTAYIGQYGGGNWSSTVRIAQNKIVGGSLPNLLWLISKWSKDKIKTNERNVEAIKLDSDALFAKKPPFIFLTGTRDFKLTDKEVENLRKYVQMGGCIWGDSSVPGQRSRFDIAFRREMRRVIPDVDKNFEVLPPNHPIFTSGYWSEVKTVPPGLNFYQEPVYALKIYGEIAILYTANDYGDMWQIGLDEKGAIDLSRARTGEYLAINPTLYENRATYVRNLTPEALATSYKFGTNVIIHLLTRWEDQVRRAPKL